MPEGVAWIPEFPSTAPPGLVFGAAWYQRQPCGHRVGGAHGDVGAVAACAGDPRFRKVRRDQALSPTFCGDGLAHIALLSAEPACSAAWFRIAVSRGVDPLAAGQR